MPRRLTVDVFAPAKVNLTLHITGKRADGYHLLDSLVAFADAGDRLVLRQANGFSVTAEGPEALSLPEDAGNLVLKAATVFDDMPGSSIHLTKHLPVSSGIGGGSADAAATIRGLMALRRGSKVSTADYDPSKLPFTQNLLRLGADIPMCLLSQCARVSGIGEKIVPLQGLPPIHAVLANPRRAVSTPSVFRSLEHTKNSAMPATLPSFSGPDDFIHWLADQRNDLETPAIRLEPQVDTVNAELRALSGCQLARMSGSGATCFGVFASKAAAHLAASELLTHRPDWWIKPVVLGSQMQRALPRFI